MNTPQPNSSGSLHPACSGLAWSHAVCMAYDAFALCLGMKPRYFTAKQVMRWLRLMQKHKQHD